MEISLELKASLIHIVLGAFMGYVSSFLKNPAIILLAMIVVLFATRSATEKFFRLKEISTEEKKYDVKWWLSNGVYPYIIFWVFVWIFFYNL